MTKHTNSLYRNLVAIALLQTFLTVTPQLSWGRAKRIQRKTPGKVSKSVLKKARRRFRRGVSLFNDGDYKAALAEFLRSNQLRAHSLTVYNIATCYSRLGEYVEAMKHYRRSVKSKPRLSWRKRRMVKRELRRLRSLLAIVKIRLNVSEATLSLSGKKSQIKNGHRLQLPAGIHILLITAPGYSPQEQRVTLAGGTVSNLRFQLSTSVRLRIKSKKSGAKVSINGRVVGSTPYSADVGPGRLRLRVEQGGHVPWDQTVVGKAGKVLRIDVNLDNPRKGFSQVWFWTAAGTAIGLAAVTLGLGLKARGYRHDYDVIVGRIQDGDYSGADELAVLQAQGRALQSDLKRFNASTNVTLGITATVAVTAAVLAFFTRFRKPKSRASITLSLLLGGGAGIFATGRIP